MKANKSFGMELTTLYWALLEVTMVLKENNEKRIIKKKLSKRKREKEKSENVNIYLSVIT